MASIATHTLLSNGYTSSINLPRHVPLPDNASSSPVHSSSYDVLVHGSYDINVRKYLPFRSSHRSLSLGLQMQVHSMTVVYLILLHSERSSSHSFIQPRARI